jgi:hypothetical protein
MRDMFDTLVAERELSSLFKVNLDVETHTANKGGSHHLE